MVVLNIGAQNADSTRQAPVTRAFPDRHATLCRVHVAIVEKRFDATGLIRPIPTEKNNTHALPFSNLHGSGRNVLEAKKTGSVLEATGVGSVDLGDAAPDAVADGDVTIGFRPETVELTEPQSSELTAEAQVVESTGSSRIVYLESGQGELRVETDRPIAQIEEMETYGLSIDPAAVHYFDAETGDRIEVDRARTSPAME
jgi:hypothetical protein